jgi:hypothetical protein
MNTRSDIVTDYGVLLVQKRCSLCPSICNRHAHSLPVGFQKRASVWAVHPHVHPILLVRGVAITADNRPGAPEKTRSGSMNTVVSTRGSSHPPFVALCVLIAFDPLRSYHLQPAPQYGGGPYGSGSVGGRSANLGFSETENGSAITFHFLAISFFGFWAALVAKYSFVIQAFPASPCASARTFSDRQGLLFSEPQRHGHSIGGSGVFDSEVPRHADEFARTKRCATKCKVMADSSDASDGNFYLLTPALIVTLHPPGFGADVALPFPSG